MKKRIFKYFFDFFEKQEEWINHMSMNGLRLVRTTKWYYEFEPCQPNEYEYKIQFVANKTYKEFQEYTEFLENLGLKTLIKPLALGRYIYRGATLRPYAKGKAMIATSPGMINNEIIIIEKQKDGKPFEIHSDTSDRIDYFKLLHKYSIFQCLFPLFMGIFYTVIMWHSEKLLIGNMIFPIIFVIGSIIYGFRTIKYTNTIKNLNESRLTNESMRVSYSNESYNSNTNKNVRLGGIDVTKFSKKHGILLVTSLVMVFIAMTSLITLNTINNGMSYSVMSVNWSWGNTWKISFHKSNYQYKKTITIKNGTPSTLSIDYKYDLGELFLYVEQGQKEEVINLKDGLGELQYDLTGFDNGKVRLYIKYEDLERLNMKVTWD